MVGRGVGLASFLCLVSARAAGAARRGRVEAARAKTAAVAFYRTSRADAAEASLAAATSRIKGLEMDLAEQRGESGVLCTREVETARALRAETALRRHLQMKLAKVQQVAACSPEEL